MDALKELHDKGMNLREQLKKFNLEDENTVLSNEDGKRVDGILSDIQQNDDAINKLKGDSERRQKALAALEDEDNQRREAYDRNPGSKDPFDHLIPDEKRHLALMGWFAEPTATGASEMEQRCMAEFGLRGGSKSIEVKLPKHGKDDHRFSNEYSKRVMSTTTDSQGGYTVPTLLHNMIVESMDKYNPWMGLGTRLRTSTGATYDIPTNDDTGNSGNIYAENTAISNTDPSFGNVQLNAYKFSSDIIKAPWELMRDSDFNLEEFFGGLMGKRIGRKSNADFTTGDNSSKPNGITNSAGDSGVTTAANTAIAYDEWVNIQIALDEPYAGNASWMFNRTVLGFAMKTKDSQGRPIFMPSLVPGAPGTILGSPYYTNPNMPTGASAKGVIYGDLSQQYIREVGTMTFVRLDELYAANGQVGFTAWQSFDSELIDAGDDPVVYATFAA